MKNEKLRIELWGIFEAGRDSQPSAERMAKVSDLIETICHNSHNYRFDKTAMYASSAVQFVKKLREVFPNLSLSEAKGILDSGELDAIHSHPVMISFIERILDEFFVIRNSHTLFWSNEDGWVEINDPNLFKIKGSDIARYRLPLDGSWTLYSTAKSLYNRINQD